MPRIDFRPLALLKVVILAVLVCIAHAPAHATHIVGAELHYECVNVSTNTFRLQLRMLRDCQNGEAPFDDVISLFIFQTASPGNPRIVTIPKPAETPRIVNTGWTLCVSNAAQPCVEEGIYSTFVTLPPVTGGYDIAWARCCRNNNIDNLNQPLNQGVTFLAHVPGPERAVCNSMATFDQSLPTFICANEDFFFDHSATDADGDSLVYRLTWPFDGVNIFGFGAGNPNTGGNQPVVDANNPMGPPPYQNVTYAPGFSSTSPFGPPPTASIDPSTGLLHFRAPSIGVFVVAISVLEYRNGLLIAENKKDLQLHVLQCLPQNQPPTIAHVFNPQDSVVGDTIFILATDTACYHVTVSDPDMSPLQVQLLSASFTGPNAPVVSMSGSNPIEIDICWPLGCAFAGGLFELALMGYDLANCPIYNPAFDTVFIRVLQPPVATPIVDHDLSPSNPMGPDTLVLEVDSTSCFDVWVLDTMGGNGPVSYSFLIEDLGGTNFMGFTVVEDRSNPDSLGLRFCTTGNCAQREHLFRLVVTGVLENICPPENTNRDTLFIYVPPLPNPPPVTRPDLSGTTLIGDTMQVAVHDTLCFVVSVNDTFPGLGLGVDAEIMELDGQPSGGFQPMLTYLSGGDSLLMQVCWYAVCDNVDGTFQIVLTGEQQNRCGEVAQSRDTVYVHVRNVINPPPVLGHSFDSLNSQVSGDTLLVAADSNACFFFELSDFGDNVFLDLEAEVLLLGGQPSGHVANVTYSLLSDSLLQGSICFVPGCAYLDQTLMVALVGRDTFDCSPSNWAFDTVLVHVVAPSNRPPVLSHDLSAVPHNGSTVLSVPIGEPYCYQVWVADPDSNAAELTASGIGNIFEDWYRYGNPASLSATGDNPLLVTVCWNPSCYDAGESFAIVVCARDTSRCALTPAVCDSVWFTIEACSLSIGNVFTPNGDGINDAFLPYDMIGVEDYRLEIYDRWGRLVFAGDNQAWDGTLLGQPGKSMPDGVYYFILRYQHFSARGVPLKAEEVGHVSLLR